MWPGMSSVVLGRQSGKWSANLGFIFVSFSLRSSWNARPSMQSCMEAMMGPGSKQPTSAGAPELSRVGGFGTQIFFGVGGGVTCGLPGARVFEVVDL
jgi:hypothetical protein